MEEKKVNNSCKKYWNYAKILRNSHLTKTQISDLSIRGFSRANMIPFYHYSILQGNLSFKKRNYTVYEQSIHILVLGIEAAKFQYYIWHHLWESFKKPCVPNCSKKQQWQQTKSSKLLEGVRHKGSMEKIQQIWIPSQPYCNNLKDKSIQVRDVVIAQSVQRLQKSEWWYVSRDKQVKVLENKAGNSKNEIVSLKRMIREGLAGKHILENLKLP